MARDHIIPKFILKGYAKNPTAPVAKQKVIVLDTETLSARCVNISDAFSIRNFNTEKTEKFLANQYEDGVAKIFYRIKDSAKSSERHVVLSNHEYKLLFRFFVVMWRRNNLHINEARKFGNQIEGVMKSVFGESGYKNMLKLEYQDVAFDDLFQEKQDELSKAFYDKVIPDTRDDDPTVEKTIKFYQPTIIHNKSNIHFTLHNSYATTIYMMPKGAIEARDMPYLIIEPISNNLCLCLMLINGEVDLSKSSFDIPIEVIEKDEKIIQHFIYDYITYNATSFVVDDTNMEIVKRFVTKKSAIKAKADSTAPPNPQMEIFKKLMEALSDIR